MITLNDLREFFMYCTAINVILLFVTLVILAVARRWVHRVHGRWFPMPEQTFTTVIYAWMGLYKIGIFLFAVVPWLALEIMARSW